MPAVAPGQDSFSLLTLLMRACRRIATLLGRPICRVWSRVAGRELLSPHAGRLLIIAANHRSILDTPLLLEALPKAIRRRTAVVAAADVFAAPATGSTPQPLIRRMRRWFVQRLVERGFDAVMVDRRSGTEGYRLINQALKLGWNILMYPEGTRSRSGALGAFQPGIALLARQADAVVVPAWIEGSDRVLPVGTRWPRAATVSIRFGEPLRVDEHETPEAFMQRLKERIVALSPQPARGAAAHA